MNLRWLWFDFVDPQLNLTCAQRRLVRRRALDLMPFGSDDPNHPARLEQRKRHVWAGCLTPVAPALCMIAIPALQKFLFPNLGWRGGLVSLFVQLAICYIVLAALLRISWQPLVIAALRDLGFNVCLKCGYHLRGLPLTVTDCPECGAMRDNPLIE